MKFKNKNVLVVGIAKSGIGAANFLGVLGANVFLYDDNKFVLNSLAGSNLLTCEYDIIFNFSKELIEFIDLIVISPSVSIYNENIKRAILAGVKVISELELAFLKAGGDLIAVTGTNGKTTTIRLLEHIFKTANLKAGTVGNIGVAFTEFLTYENSKPTYITEVSSFQLEAVAKFAPKIACILNLTPDHLDRHYTFENYVKTKAKIFKKQKRKDFAVLNYDDKEVFQLKSNIKSQIYFFSTREKLERGVFLRGSNIVFSDGSKEQTILCSKDLLLLGEHNLSNVLCAVLCCMLYGVNKKQIREGVKTFKGVEHRLQFVKVKNKISYYNDSKATNIDACLKAVSTVPNNLVLILGGSDKVENYDELFKKLPSNVKEVVVTGSNTNKFLKSAKSFGFNKIMEAKNLEVAVKLATSLAKSNYAVLLSPASASFDSFKDYKHRGEEFVRLIEEAI